MSARIALGVACASLLAASPAAWAMFKCHWPDQTSNYATQRQPGARCERAGLVDAPAPVAAPTPAKAAAPQTSAAPAGLSTTAVDASSPLAGAQPSIDTGSAPATATQAPPRSYTRTREVRVYAYVVDGVRHFSNRKPVGVSERVQTLKLTYVETCFLCGPRAVPGGGIGALRLDTQAYRAEIDLASRDFGVEAALVRAVVHAESGYRSNVISRAGAQGLMQLMPATAERFSVKDPFDAAQNIRGGVAYLAWLLKRFDGNVDLALAGFNAGEGAVARYSGIPPYAETQTYVARVKALAQRYRGVPSTAAQE
ncbi:MAG: transglycosylase [Cupriavidus sp.]|jgi:soluble lytic murein transglycosylase-like protein|uniref:lytic transglycosylase domain-containing protein n=2 Tax=Cupriavidus pauculus TaxID=82633 RepID=UPI000C432CD6|nr:lytic transglycosylase domain-containing protein [Cupriavidus pauculus]MBU66844.1 transglycosylase [Cupriavidus sp.]MCM3606054.1 lytic transglycosylase domain-containing protein [Cupriavidus pauculus]